MLLPTCKVAAVALRGRPSPQAQTTLDRPAAACPAAGRPSRPRPRLALLPQPKLVPPVITSAVALRRPSLLFLAGLFVSTERSIADTGPRLRLTRPKLGPARPFEKARILAPGLPVAEKLLLRRTLRPRLVVAASRPCS